MISCDKCEEWYHGICVGVSKAQGQVLAKKNLPWNCPKCRTVQPATVTAVTPESGEEKEELATSSGPTDSSGPTEEAHVESTPKPVEKKVQKIPKTPLPAHRPVLKIKPKKQSEPKPKPEKVEELPVETKNDGLVGFASLHSTSPNCLVKW